MESALATASKDTGLTISLPLAIWGSGYSQFLPQWWRGVQKLETKPTEIVIVTDKANHSAVMESIPDGVEVRVEKRNLQSYAQFWNEAVRLTTGKWIAFCNVDDEFVERGLNAVPVADQKNCNLVCDVIRTRGTDQYQQTRWQPRSLDERFDLGGANPMTRELFDAAQGFPEGIRFADWGMALYMRKTGLVKAFRTSETRIIFDRGYNRLTMSGALLGPDERAKANEQIRELARSL